MSYISDFTELGKVGTEMVLKRSFIIPIDGAIEDHYKVDLELRVRLEKYYDDAKTIELVPITDLEKYTALSFSSNIFIVSIENRKENIKEVSVGQNYNKILEAIQGIKNKNLVEDEILANLKDLEKIIELWKEYHLNNFNAGTDKQKVAIDQNPDIKFKRYDLICEYLKSIDLYEDRGYRYGSSWLIRLIPKDVLDSLSKLF